MTKRILMLSCAAGAITALAGAADAATATATSTASTASQNSSVVAEVVVTAEKREQNLQVVPIAITAFTAKKRDDIGINSIQDMTNFTPGLTYSTSTDRITLRGVGRTTNVLSAQTPVANYDDGLFETFAVAAGRSSLELADVDVERGPQGTLGGRNALAGALNEVTHRPTMTPQAEVRLTYGNYDHLIAEAAVSGPINDVWQYRAYFNWEYQGEGWIQNIVPNRASEGNNINEWYGDWQIQAKFNDHLEMWTKFQAAQWFNPSGGPGDQSAGWTRAGYPTYEFEVAGVVPLAGYACAPGTSALNVVNISPDKCFNPAQNSPWTEAQTVDHQVELPVYVSLNSQWTWHADGFDIKYIGGGTYYHYQLYGDTEGANAPITSFEQPCAFIPNCAAAPAGVTSAAGGIVVAPTDSFTYQEFNGFWSDELNFISTGHGPLQWVAGVYQYYQAYQQPVSAEDLQQPQLNGPFAVPAAVCAQTGGACAPETMYRWFDNRPDLKDQSYAIYGQVDYKIVDTVKLTLGLRYSWDRVYGEESVRLTCYLLPACFTVPELNPFITPATNGTAVGGIPVLDLTQVGSVVASGTAATGGLPQGVTGVTTYNAANGLATRNYDGRWSAPSGTAGIEWTPDSQSLYYFKYGRGYKQGGFNVGIFTVESFDPYTAAEGVNSFELGAKHTFGHWLTADVALYYYDYTNLQIPISLPATAGGLNQSTTEFYNVPESVSRGIELETTWTPIDNLTVTFNYSYDDAHVARGQAPDPADPNAVEPGAHPLYTAAQCLAGIANKNPPCTQDVYTETQAQATQNASLLPPPATAPPPTFYNAVNPIANDPNYGWNIPQNLAGNPLPNAPKNKLAINVLYDWHLSNGAQFIPSLSYFWRDKQYGLFFNDPNWAAPAWNEWDARATYTSPSGKFTVIFFIKNIFNTIGYDQGALATRAAGIVDVPCGCASGYVQQQYVQGLNGPVGYNNHLVGSDQWGVYSTYYVTPPRTVGIELHYKFY